MGMTIDEAIRYYENKNVVLTEEEALANTIAIETMRKYQRIEDIYYHQSGEALENSLRTVVEDGKID